MPKQLLPLLIALLVSACGAPRIPSSLADLPGPSDLPFIYKVDVQQGNVVDQDMLAQLRPQMDKKKILFIMGSPIIQDTFHADRWDYIYTEQKSGGDIERRLITLYFKDDKLDHIGGDVQPAESPLVATLHHDTTVKVPQLRNKGFVDKVKEKIPFVGPAEEKVEEVDIDDAAAEQVEADTDPVDDVNLPVLADDTPAPRSPYADLQAAPGEGIIVPPDAPTGRKPKGFFARLVDSIGLGPDEDDAGADEGDYDPGDPRYRDITDPDQF